MSRLNQRVRKRRDHLRKAGLRPVQLRVPDSRKRGFATECERQCRIANGTAADDAGLDRISDAAAADMGDWTA